MAKLSSEVELILDLKITDLDSGEYHEFFCIPTLNPRGECTIGRSRGCHLVLNAPEINRLQSRILVQPNSPAEAYWLVEPNPKVDCYLNNQKILPDKCYKLNPSDTILIGNFFILIHAIEQISKAA
jgi:hypothetical protein